MCQKSFVPRYLVRLFLYYVVSHLVLHVAQIHLIWWRTSRNWAFGIPSCLQASFLFDHQLLQLLCSIQSQTNLMLHRIDLVQSLRNPIIRIVIKNWRLLQNICGLIVFTWLDIYIIRQILLFWIVFNHFLTFTWLYFI